MKNYLFIVIISVGLLFSCKEQKEPIPDNVLKPDKMVSVMTDIHLIEATLSTSNLPRDSSLFVFSLYKKDLYKKHGINDSIYKLSFDYYTSHPDLIDKIYERTIDSLTLRAGKEKH
jgi:hypothetical protein